MADEQPGVVPDEAYWNQLAATRGPGFAAAQRGKFEAATPAAPLDAAGPTVAPLPPIAAAPTPPAALAPSGAPATPAAETAVATPKPPIEQEQFQPPGPQTVSTTDARTQIQMGQKLDPEIEAARHESQATELEARAKANAVEAEQARKLAEVETQRIAAQAAARAKDEAAAKERKRIADEHAAKVEAAQKDADAVKLPPEEDFGTQFKNSIAIALGALGSGLTGGPNHAADIVKSNRDEKMRTWKAQYERAKGKVDDARNLYALFRNKGLDEESSEALAAKNLNEGYDAVIRQHLAGNKSALVSANGQASLESIRQNQLAQDQRLQQSAQNTVTRVVDEKSMTKNGGAEPKEKRELIKQAADDDHIKAYNGARSSFNRFNDMVKSGASGSALVDFVASGLKQGSFGPSFVDLLKKRGFIDNKKEMIRAAWEGGAPPDLIKEINNSLAANVVSTGQRATPSLRHYGGEFRRAGIDPQIITGGETSDEAAAQAGATPSAYQGVQ